MARGTGNFVIHRLDTLQGLSKAAIVSSHIQKIPQRYYTDIKHRRTESTRTHGRNSAVIVFLC